jgi:tetratricopeptide (TPR) repeat protein
MSGPVPLAFGLVALTIAAYWGSFSGVIEGDAAPLVSSDARVHAATLENLHLIATRTYWSSITTSNVYRPLVTLSWMLNYVGFGNRDRALGYHVFNLTLHLMNVILAWLVILRIWGEPLPAFLAAAVFAIHPVNTEAVTNIAGRADLMAATGVLAGLLLHMALPEKGWKRNMALAGLALASCFGFLSKENAVALPALMILYDLLFRRRAQAGSYIAVLGPIVAIVAWRHWMLPGLVDRVIVVDNPIAAASFWRGRLTAIEVLWRYLGLLAWPRQLSWDYSYNQIPIAGISAGLVALGGLLLLLGLLLWRSSTPVCFFGLFFFVTLLPTSNVLLVIGSIMAERFLYLPSIGFAVCLVAAAGAIVRGLAPARAVWITAMLFTAVVAALGARTWVRNGEWTDGVKLWDSGVEVSPNSFKTHLSRINSFYRRGLDMSSLDASIDEALKAVAIVGDLPPQQSTAQPLQTLGALYQLKGETVASFESPQQWYSKALETFAQAVALDTLLRETERQRALAQGIPKDRIRFGGSSFLYSHLGDTYRHLGRFPEALEAFRHLSAITPTDAAVYEQVAQVQQAMGSSENAVITLWEAQTLQPMEANETDLARTYRKLGLGGCAVVDDKPNQSCPTVRADICRARKELADRVAESGLVEESARLRRDAKGCD